MEKRPVEVIVRTYDADGVTFNDVPKHGIFHQWGIKQYKSKDKSIASVMQTVGIVEFTDGKVYQAYPDSMKFLDVATGF